MFALISLVLILASIMTGTADLGFIFLVGSVPFVVLLCTQVGTRLVFAAFALLDSVAFYPLFLYNGGLEWSAYVHWALPTYAVVLLMTLWLATGRALPDAFLPLKGIWARKLLVTGCLIGLIGLPCADLARAPKNVWIVLAIPLFFTFVAALTYVVPLWTVLVHGWDREQEGK